MINAKPFVDKGLRSKKMNKSDRRARYDLICLCLYMFIIINIHQIIYTLHRNNSDDWGDSMPTPDVLTNVEDENQFENPLHKQKSSKKSRKNKGKDIRANSITNIASKRKQPQTKKEMMQSKTPKAPKSPSPNRNMNYQNKGNAVNSDQSDSEYFADIQPNDNRLRAQKPNITPNRGNRRESAPNVKKRQSPSDYIFRSEESMEKEQQQIKEQRDKNKKKLRAQHQHRKKTAPTKRLPPNSRSRSPSPNPNKKPLPKVISYSFHFYPQHVICFLVRIRTKLIM